jgi:DNA-binding CsgD family transcriptional regulator
MSARAYVGSGQRTFRQAILHLLESEYRLLGSQRVLEMLANDLQSLAESFYPAPEHLASGWMVFTGTKASGAKAYPGQRVAEHELVTLAWPVLLAEDIDYLAQHSDTQAALELLSIQRLIRIIEYGAQHPLGPILLSLADLALLLGIAERKVSQLLQSARQQTGKPLLTLGYYFDQGIRPTHKVEIIALYEQGLDESEVARRMQHSPESVGAYIRDYERVKLLLSHHTPLDQIPVLISLQPGIVQAYAQMVAQYHPELLAES